MEFDEAVLLRVGDPRERIAVPPNGLTLGRSSDCDVVLREPSVSRRHARLLWHDGGLHVEDLGSSNGIEVNGARVARAPLADGDELMVGDVRFRVGGPGESTLHRSTISSERAAHLPEHMAVAGDHERLLLLYRAAQLLGDVFDIDELLAKVLALVFDALPVRRGYVMTFTGESETPVVRASRVLDSSEGPPVSRTLVSRVFSRREAVLTIDARTDSRFDASASIVGHGIQAALCAPLVGRTRVMGVLYADAGDSGRRFTDEDLEVLTAVARVAGAAAENAELYRENLEKERMAAVGLATAGLGHCVKNIITVFRGGSDLIGYALSRNDLKPLEKGWPMLLGALQRIDLLVMNMLHYSKPRTPIRRPEPLYAIAAEVCELARPQAERAGVQLHLEPGPPAHVAVDRMDIHRLLLNLVINGVEACGRKGGEVWVRCQQAADGWAIEVSDTGAGIPAEVLAKIPQAFLSTKGNAGTGLGLACCYKIAAEHGGRIEVASEEGRGTRFRLLLPDVRD